MLPKSYRPNYNTENLYPIQCLLLCYFSESKVWQYFKIKRYINIASLYCFGNSLFHTSGFKDTGDYWRSAYESATFQEDLENLLTELKPLYAQLHTYVRNQLRSLYGADKFPRSGHIPAHLLGKQNQVYPLVQNNKHVCLFNLSSVYTIILVNALSPFC